MGQLKQAINWSTFSLSGHFKGVGDYNGQEQETDIP
jgi:hypothetical protein